MEEISLMIANTREELFRAREARMDADFSSSDYLQKEFLVELLESKLDNLEWTRDIDERTSYDTFSRYLG